MYWDIHICTGAGSEGTVHYCVGSIYDMKCSATKRSEVFTVTVSCQLKWSAETERLAPLLLLNSMFLTFLLHFGPVSSCIQKVLLN